MVLAGTNLYDPCGFSNHIADHLLHVSSATTQSEKGFWFIHDVNPGPAIHARNTSAVSVARSAELVRMLVIDQLAASSASSPSPNATQSVIATQSDVFTPAPSPAQLTKLYDSSVVIHITVYLNAKSHELMYGHFMDFITSHKVVTALKGRDVHDVEWAGFTRAPSKVDKEIVKPTVQTNSNQITMTAGAISSFVVLGAMSTALGGFIVLEAALSSAAVAASGATGV